MTSTPGGTHRAGSSGAFMVAFPETPYPTAGPAVTKRQGRGSNGIGDAAAFRVDYSNSQSDNWVQPNGDSKAEMLALSFQWDVSDDLVLSARLDSQIENAATSLGAGQPTILARIILPQIIPSIRHAIPIYSGVLSSSPRTNAWRAE